MAALLADMKQRGLLEQTLVVWCTEFGRMPTFQVGASGRDHNPDGFTAWLAGAGVKRGHTHGATDEFSYKAVQMSPRCTTSTRQSCTCWGWSMSGLLFTTTGSNAD